MESTAGEFEAQLVANSQPNLSAFEFRHGEVRYSLVVETDVPSDRDVVFRLRLLQPLVVVGFNLDEWTEDVLILVSVFIPGR